MGRLFVIAVFAVVLAGCGTQTQTVTETPQASVTTAPVPVSTTSAASTSSAAQAATTTLTPATSSTGTSTVESATGPQASYCEDGQCETVSCPPTQASDDWICEQSSNSAARAAVETTGVPTCDVVSVMTSAGREVISGQDNCEAAGGSFAVLWYVDQGPEPCDQAVGFAGTHLVMDDEYLAEPVCAEVAAGSGASPPWAQVALALSTESEVAAGATQRQLP